EDGRRSCRVYSLPLDLSTAESAQLTSGSQSDIPAEGYRFDAPLAGDYRFDKLEPVALSDLIQRGPPGGGVVATFESNEPYWKAVLTEADSSSARPQLEVAFEREYFGRLEHLTVLSTTDGIMKLKTNSFWEKAEAFFFKLPFGRAPCCHGYYQQQ
ncbi:hypothetical protein FOZ62_014407, partial [Perkinsus olseni]